MTATEPPGAGGEDARVESAAQEVLDFWFGAPRDPAFGTYRAAWFKQDTAFDALCRARFGALHAEVAAADARSWSLTPGRALAYVIVLDQFSRNLFRGTPQAFAFDPQALAMAAQAVDAGFDVVLPPLQRAFLYMPFEHSEALADQRRAVELFATLAAFPETAEMVPYAQMHYDVIERFGRFPHRNSILGRASTPAEEAYLRQPGAGF